MKMALVRMSYPSLGGALGWGRGANGVKYALLDDALEASEGRLALNQSV